MNILIAMDSMKGSLTSVEAGEAVADGIKKVMKSQDELCVVPFADGGEGTLNAFMHMLKLQMQQVRVSGPFGEPVNARYAIWQEEQRQTAILEMASCAGLMLVNEKDKDPYKTTTFGVGEMILDALEKGCTNFLIGIGGSATNDGGVGMLQALGFEFLDDAKKQIPMGAYGLSKLVEIKDTYVPYALKKAHFTIACDVTNPLCGKDGASAVFGPQKGADEKMVSQMDLWLQAYAKKAQQINSKANPMYPGTGAAGGMGFAFYTFLGAELKPGIQILIEKLQIEDKVKKADLVITGEGKIDGQTAFGKAPVGMAFIAKKYHKPVIALGGIVTKEASVLHSYGIDAIFPILHTVTTLENNMSKETATENLSATAEEIYRLLHLYKNKV